VRKRLYTKKERVKSLGGGGYLFSIFSTVFYFLVATQAPLTNLFSSCAFHSRYRKAHEQIGLLESNRLLAHASLIWNFWGLVNAPVAPPFVNIIMILQEKKKPNH
jgi:hypothetical protein